jgi:hypothetical protein
VHAEAGTFEELTRLVPDILDRAAHTVHAGHVLFSAIARVCQHGKHSMHSAEDFSAVLGFLREGYAPRGWGDRFAREINEPIKRRGNAMMMYHLESVTAHALHACVTKPFEAARRVAVQLLRAGVSLQALALGRGSYEVWGAADPAMLAAILEHIRDSGADARAHGSILLALLSDSCTLQQQHEEAGGQQLEPALRLLLELGVDPYADACFFPRRFFEPCLMASPLLQENVKKGLPPFVFAICNALLLQHTMRTSR